MGHLIRAEVIQVLEPTQDAAVIVVPAESHRSGTLSRTLASGVQQAAADPLMDLRRHAEQLREEAEAQAANIRAAAERDAAQMHESAWRSGYQEGLAAARQEIEQACGQQLRELVQVHADLAALRGRLLQEFETAGLELATVMADRILRADVARDPALLTAMLTELLEPLMPVPTLGIRVHPEDLSCLQEKSASLAGGMAGGTIAWVADPSLPPGSLKVTFEGGDLDASLHSQLIRLKAELLLALCQSGRRTTLTAP